jgi:hypothetical protein
LYPWHPWFGLMVHVHEAVERRSTSTLRCSLDGRVRGRWLELPAWMFEPDVCLPMRIAPTPQTNRTALARLGALLRDAAGISAGPVLLNEPVSGVGRDPCHQNRRVTDAPSGPKSRKTRTRTPSAGFVPPSQPGTGVAPSAEGRQSDRDELDGAAVARAPASRGSRRDGRTAR